MQQRLWLNVLKFPRNKRRCFRRATLSAMQPAYVAPLDMPLPYPEDQTLTYMTTVVDVQVYKPPGIQNLRLLPEGRHKNSTFMETVEKDYKYAQWIIQHKNLTSDLAWNKMNMVTVQEVTTPRPMAKGKGSMKKNPEVELSEDEEELIVIPDGRKSEGKLTTLGKRSWPAERITWPRK